MSTQLHESFDRLGLRSDVSSGHPSAGGLDVPPVRKQRSQRFTIPTSPPNGSPAQSRSPAPPVPALPYQAPPPPVQSQSVTTDPYYSFNRDPPVERSASTDAPYGAAEEQYASHLGGAFALPTQQPQYQPYRPTHLAQHAYGQPSYSSGYVPAPSPGGYGGAGGGGYQRGGGRQEQSNGGGGGGMRSGLPTEWMRQAPPQQQQPSYQTGYAALMGRPLPEDEVIPTALVIKNIPFQVPKEQLLGVMEDLRLPPPFAFNYHYDNGTFRGLSFANYRNANDAALTVSALNGFDLQGRKLRAEFKKVLKEGEKERIERDKAIKRMRSTRELVSGGVGGGGGGESLGPPPGWNRREASAPGGYPMSHSYSAPAPMQQQGGEEEDYGRLVTGQYSTPVRSFGAREYVPAPVESVYSQGAGQGNGNGYSASPPSDVGTSISARMANTSSGSGSEASVGKAFELDLNDPQALEIYSRVLIFKDDSLRDELAFARSLSALQRRTVHLVAKKLGLEHRSVGQGEDRHVVVFKGGAGSPLSQSQGQSTLSIPEQQQKPLRHSASTLGRSNSRDLLSSYLSPPDASYSSPTSLRGKKSMPDIRGANGYGLAPHYQQQQQQQHVPVNQRRSNLNLREGYATVGTAARGATRPSVQGIFQSSNFFEPGAPTATATAATQYYSSEAGAGSGESSATTSEEASMGGQCAGAGQGQGQGFVVRQPRGPSEEGWRGA